MTDRSKQRIDEKDPLEAIYALNMGDFVAEHLISDDLLAKVASSARSNPDQMRRQLEELVQIYSLDKTLSLLGFDSKDGFILYDSIATSLTNMFEVDACHIFQTTRKNETDAFLSLTGTSVQGVPSSRWHIGYDLADTSLLVTDCYNDGFPMAYTEISDTTAGWKPLDELQQGNVSSLLVLPLNEGPRRMGLLMFECYQPTDFSHESVELAETTANVFVISLRLQRLVSQAQQLIWQEDPSVDDMRTIRAQLTEAIGDLGRYQQYFVESLANAIDARNDFSQGHSKGVAQIAKHIALSMALNEKTVDLVYYASLVGSLGKIDVPKEILSKEESLTPEERNMLRNHPNIGVGFLMKMNFLAEVIPYVQYQKERWDGQDSPYGLSGRSIPLGSRILAVADAYHALTHPRPYRETPLSQEEALKVLQSESGTKWDPDVVDTVANMDADSLT